MQGKIIWYDFNKPNLIAAIILSMGWVLFLIMFFFFSDIEYIQENKFFVLIATLALFGFLIIHNRINYCEITSEGIILGEPFFNWKGLFFLNKKEFVKWNIIKKIYSVERQKKMGKVADLIYLLTIETELGSKHCTIMDKNGFEKALKKLHKEDILFRDYKYSKILDADISDSERERLIEKLEKREKIL